MIEVMHSSFAYCVKLCYLYSLLYYRTNSLASAHSRFAISNDIVHQEWACRLVKGDRVCCNRLSWLFSSYYNDNDGENIAQMCILFKTGYFKVKRK